MKFNEEIESILDENDLCAQESGVRGYDSKAINEILKAVERRFSLTPGTISELSREERMEFMSDMWPPVGTSL